MKALTFDLKTYDFRQASRDALWNSGMRNLSLWRALAPTWVPLSIWLALVITQLISHREALLIFLFLCGAEAIRDVLKIKFLNAQARLQETYHRAQGLHVLSAQDAGLHLKTELCTYMTPWSLIRAVACTKDGLLVIANSAQFIPIPDQAFEDQAHKMDTLTFLNEKIKQT